MNIIIKGDMTGDIISDGGVKNVTNHHYGEQQEAALARTDKAEILVTILPKGPISIHQQVAKEFIVSMRLIVSQKG